MIVGFSLIIYSGPLALIIMVDVVLVLNEGRLISILIFSHLQHKLNASKKLYRLEMLCTGCMDYLGFGVCRGISSSHSIISFMVHTLLIIMESMQTRQR